MSLVSISGRLADARQRATEALDSIEKHPRMWGSLDAAEQLYITYVEMLLVLRGQELGTREVLDEWIKHINELYPERLNQPLIARLDETLSREAMDEAFRTAARSFRDKLMPPLVATLHVYGQQHEHDVASIVANRQGLYSLSEALTEAVDHGYGVAQLTAADGEGYTIVVVCDDKMAENFDTTLPYSLGTPLKVYDIPGVPEAIRRGWRTFP